MANAHFVTPALLTGGDLHHDPTVALDQLAELVEAGVTHIIDNRIEWTDEEFVRAHAPHIRYLHNPTDDCGQQMEDSWFDDARAFARSAFLDPDARMLVHCHMGINRGPSAAYSILLDQGLNAIEAFDRIRTARPIAHMGYVDQALDHHLRSQGVPAADRRRALAEPAELAELAEHQHHTGFKVADVIRKIRAAEGGSLDAE